MPKLYKTIGTIEDVFPKNKEYFSLKELQSNVGGYIERIHGSNSENIILVNEEARIKKLPFNELASIQLGTDLFGDVLECEDKYIT
jgi:hypothetical protein